MPITVRQALGTGHKSLRNRGTDTVSLDTSLLLALAMDCTREHMYMSLDTFLPSRVYTRFISFLSRRLGGEPVAWILGQKEFWGNPFLVGEGVLCPRPDTETLVEHTLKLMNTYPCPGKLHDCCTGPGTIALSLSKERPDWTISASDISHKAQHYFEINNNRLAGGRVDFIHSNLMETIQGFFDIIVCNPPYLTHIETVSRKDLNKKEPALALDGGTDGLDLVRRIIPSGKDKLKPGGWLFLEASTPQMPIIQNILHDSGYAGISIYKDTGGRDRVIGGQKPLLMGKKDESG